MVGANGLLAFNATAASWTSDVAGKALVALAVAVAGLAVALAARAALRRWVRPRLHHTAYKPLENVVFYSVLGLGLAAALTPFGFDATILLLTGGIAGIVLGIASQTVVSNLLSGFFLLAERPFRIGDHVSLAGYEGVVVDVNVFSTVVRTWDGVLVRLPNEKVFGDRVVNLAKTAARRLELSVTIPYTVDVSEARRALAEVVESYHYCLVRPRPEIYVRELGDHGVVLRVRCWVPTPAWFEARLELLELVYEALRRKGIEVPYPQLDVHIRDAPAFEPERLLGAARGAGEAEAAAGSGVEG